ncbi:RsmD family RNA methyltransferase [Aeoliella sp.]|uniref:RsmD family RNA methyltransferase n=1 Tax=Aeoliella sp. TaxID=2795800 RepID=UPI003CCC36CD
MSRRHKSNDSAGEGRETEIRIIGGQYRGSRLAYHGDPVTRPMKHRVREAIFNLIGLEAEGRHALDLFAGTGALGLEALSRGAASALFIERHIPTARVVRENIAHLDVDDECTVLEASAFVWAKRDLPTGKNTPDASRPWLVFVSPPYAFFVDRQQEMLDLVTSVLQHAPPASTMVVEADERFDFSLLPGPVREHRRDDGWDIRTYLPAVVGVWRKE